MRDQPPLDRIGYWSEINLDSIAWVIVGGESGPGARPMKKEWVLAVRDQCKCKGVPFFFKQWGGVRKSAAGRRLNGTTYDEFPHRVQHPIMPVEQCLALALKFEAPFKTTDLLDVSSLTQPPLELAV